MIRESSEVESLTNILFLHDQGFLQGQSLDWWSAKGVLTDSGNAIFASVTARNASLRTPLATPTIRVTGVTQLPMDEAARIAEFEWGYRDLAPELKSVAVAGGRGSCIARLYDDGWRLEKLTLDRPRAAARLTEEERQAVASYWHEALARQNERRQRLAEIYSDSQQVHRSLGHYRPEEGWNPFNNTEGVSFELTDVGLIADPDNPWTYRGREKVFYWFGVVRGIKREKDAVYVGLTRDVPYANLPRHDPVFNNIKVYFGSEAAAVQFSTAVSGAWEAWTTRFGSDVQRYYEDK